MLEFYGNPFWTGSKRPDMKMAQEARAIDQKRGWHGVKLHTTEVYRGLTVSTISAHTEMLY